MLALLCSPGNEDEYVPICLPPLPDAVSSDSVQVQMPVLRLAKSLGVTGQFNFKEALHNNDIESKKS